MSWQAELFDTRYGKYIGQPIECDWCNMYFNLQRRNMLFSGGEWVMVRCDSCSK